MENNKRNILQLVGFSAVDRLGRDIGNLQTEIISNYAESNGADKKYVKSVLEKEGRPFDIIDYTFTKKCHICNILRNYCCC